MYAVIGFLVSSLMVFLARISYLFFFDQECSIQQCLLEISDIHKMMYIGAILIGTYNAYLISKNRKNSVLILEFIGTFIFAFALNFFDIQ